MNSRVFFFFFAVARGSELRSAVADLGVPKSQWIRQEGETEAHDLPGEPLDTSSLHKRLLLLTPPAWSAEGMLDEPKPDNDKDTPDKGTPDRGPKEICRGHSILDDMAGQTGDDHFYTKAYGSILNAFKVAKHVLEIGDGQFLTSSLQRWASVFPQASLGGLVVGNVEPPGPHAERTWTAKAGDHLNLGLIAQEAEGRAADSDIVIDRTGRDLRTSKYQLGVWLSAYHLVINGGLYIVEDVNALNPLDDVAIPNEHAFCRLTFGDPMRLGDEEVEQTGFSLAGEINRAGFFLSLQSSTAGDANMLVIAKHWPSREVHFYPEDYKIAAYYKVLNVLLRGEPVRRILALLANPGTAPWKRAYPQATFLGEPEGCVDVLVTSAKAAGAKYESWRADFASGVQFLRKGGYAIIQDLDFTFCGRSAAPGPDFLGDEVASVLEQNPNWFWAMPNDDEQQASKMLILRKQ